MKSGHDVSTDFDRTMPRYDKPGEIERDDAEIRLLRAIRVLAVVRDREAEWLKVRILWPFVAEITWADMLARNENYEYLAEVAAEDASRWFSPSRKDMGDYLTALDWWARLEETDREIVRLRAFKWGFQAIGRRTGRGRDNARARYKSAVRQCWRWANIGKDIAHSRREARAAFATRG